MSHFIILCICRPHHIFPLMKEDLQEERLANPRPLLEWALPIWIKFLQLDSCICWRFRNLQLFSIYPFIPSSLFSLTHPQDTVPLNFYSTLYLSFSISFTDLGLCTSGSCLLSFVPDTCQLNYCCIYECLLFFNVYILTTALWKRNLLSLWERNLLSLTSFKGNGGAEKINDLPKVRLAIYGRREN